MGQAEAAPEAGHPVSLNYPIGYPGDTPEPEWCEECGCPRYIADRSWEVDVSRDGPDGPEYLIAILDCDHQLTLAGPRSQRLA